MKIRPAVVYLADARPAMPDLRCPTCDGRPEMATPVMNCKRTHDLLGPYLDGELPLDLVRPMRTHLDECAPCRAEADEIRSLGGLVREAGQTAPTGLGARILAEARAAQEDSRPLRLSLAAAWPRAAAMLLGATMVGLSMTSLTSASSTPPVGSRAGLHAVISESEADLELAGSFTNDFRALAARPEGRLMYDLTGAHR